METDFTQREKQIMDILLQDPFAIRRSPCVILVEDSDISYIGKDVYCEDVLKSLERPKDLKKAGTVKIKVDFYILSQLYVCMIDKKFFSSRNVLDKMCFESWFSPHKDFPFKEENVEEFGDVTFQDAFKKFDCTILCNIDYYLNHRNEIWRYLNTSKKRGFLRHQKNDEVYIRDLENEILFKLLIDVLGDIKDKEEHNKKTIILRDFRFIYSFGGYRIGTSERGNHYLLFFYEVN